MINNHLDINKLPESILGKDTPEPLLYAFSHKSSAHAGSSAKMVKPQDFSSECQRALSEEVKIESQRCLYIHIPFCRVRCTYCNFFQHASSRALVEQYFEALLKEIEWKSKQAWTQAAPFQAVYLGGGTPTDLSADQIERLGKAIRHAFPLTSDCEITLEGRLHRFDNEMFDKALEGGFNRFSFGVQSFDTKVRRSAKRLDDKAYIMDRIQALSHSHQATIVIDLLYGLPYQTQEIWRQDLHDFLESGAHGVDLYQLIEMQGMSMTGLVEKGKLAAPATTAEKAYMYKEGVAFMAQNHMKKLSVNHWARDNRERSLYNSLAKTTAEVLPIGCGSGGNVGGLSLMQHRHLEAYFKAIESGEMPIAMMMHSASDAGLYSTIKAAFDRGVIARETLLNQANFDAFRYLQPLFQHWQKRGLGIVNHDYFSLTLAGEFWAVTLAQGVISTLQQRATNLTVHREFASS